MIGVYGGLKIAIPAVPNAMYLNARWNACDLRILLFIALKRRGMCSKVPPRLLIRNANELVNGLVQLAPEEIC